MFIKFAKSLIYILKIFLSKFGIHIEVARIYKNSDHVLIDKAKWEPYLASNKNFEQYKKSQIAVDGQEFDNIYKQLRFYNLIQYIRQTLKTNPNGTFVECGVWKGHSAHITASLIRENNSSNKLYLFDSFEGLSERDIEDSSRIKMSKTEIQAEAKKFAFSEDLVKNNLKEFDFISYYKGWIPERFKEVSDERFCFVHIDVDLYQPILDSLNFFSERLENNGYIFLDDYGDSYFMGAKKALEEFNPPAKGFVFFELPLGGAYLQKIKE